MKLLNDSSALKDGRIAQIFYSNGLADCRATVLMLRTSAELIEKGFSIDYGIGIFNSAEVIWAECNSIPIGGICYYKQTQHMSQHWILLSFTDSDWRGLGVNGICHAELEKLTLEAGLSHITSLVHINNTSRIQSCKKVGMTGEFYRMSKKLTKEIK
jgi:hypothetical protein